MINIDAGREGGKGGEGKREGRPPRRQIDPDLLAAQKRARRVNRELNVEKFPE
jgi:hypothetical protein